MGRVGFRTVKSGTEGQNHKNRSWGKHKILRFLTVDFKTLQRNWEMEWMCYCEEIKWLHRDCIDMASQYLKDYRLTEHFDVIGIILSPIWSFLRKKRNYQNKYLEAEKDECNWGRTKSASARGNSLPTSPTNMQSVSATSKSLVMTEKSLFHLCYIHTNKRTNEHTL